MTWILIPINHKIILTAMTINLKDHKEMKEKNKMMMTWNSIYSTIPLLTLLLRGEIATIMIINHLSLIIKIINLVQEVVTEDSTIDIKLLFFDLCYLN